MSSNVSLDTRVIPGLDPGTASDVVLNAAL
jgi:hypothetical protein